MNTPSQNPKPAGWAESTIKTPGEVMPNLMSRIKALPPEELARRQKEAEERNAVSHQSKVSELRASWNVWKRHRICQPSRAGQWGDKLAALEKDLGTGFLSAVVGVGGNGKTQMGVELMKATTEREQPALFCTATGFFIEVKASYRKDSEVGELEVLRKYRKPKLLVIDEFGKRGESEWETHLLFDLINNRYGDMTDTLLIDNRTKAEFVETIGPSLASRMMETGGIIEASWPSFR